MVDGLPVASADAGLSDGCSLSAEPARFWHVSHLASLWSRDPSGGQGRGITPYSPTTGAWVVRRARGSSQGGGRLLVERDGSIRIAWHAEGYEAIHVRARFRSREELAAWARGVADEALLERSLRGLQARLRERYPGAFDLMTLERAGEPGTVVVTFHPPKGTPRPDD